MYLLILAIIVFAIIKILSATSAKVKENKRQAELARVKAEQIRQREEIKRQQAEARAWTQRQIALEQQAMRREREEAEAWRKQQEWNAKQEENKRKEDARMARLEQRTMKLEQRMATAENEIAFNREQIDRQFKLLQMVLDQRDACTYGSSEWQKFEKKAISYENQIHTLQKRIDKAKADKYFCENARIA